ncbi:hypothetical protein EV207_13823 [Scopulibacillus darangshiensis]|uniref:Spore germination protein GerPA/GerPF n=1 Tax=Scopulibacillus darangshiensis TaxID=442528 RepID=A0A4V2SL42_9BACL|nr:hypothetical protein [Scopulibacillus darangshiensis]TCP21936.1 hypothetical protein EV207_13823 [Scopulibacillus darangshiensis]
MRPNFDQNFVINTLNIHTVEGASCVNVGNNFPTGFQNFKKHTQGFGSISGDNNQIDGIRSLVNDGSHFDTSSASDLDNNKWIKELMADKMQEVLDAEDIFSIDDLEYEEDDEDDDEQDGDISESDESEVFNDVDDIDHMLDDVFDDEEES